MDTKQIIWIGVLVGSVVGGYIPALWGAGLLSFSGIIFSTLGAFAGLWLAFKVSQ